MPEGATRRRGSGGLASRRSAVLSKGLLAALVLLATAGLVGISTRSTFAALFAIGVAGYALVIVVIGIRRTAALTLMAAFATAPAYKGLASSPSATVTPTDLLLFVGLVVLAPTVFAQRVRLPGTYLVGLGIITVMGLTASTLADESFRSFLDLVQLLGVMAILPIAIALWHPSTRVVELLAGSYVAGHVLSTLYGMATGPMEGGDRYAGLSHHPNAFAEAGMMAFALLLFLYHRCRTRLTRLLALAALAICAGSVVMSGSRAAVVVVAALVVVVPLVERSAVSGFLLAAGGALALAMLPTVLTFSGEGSALTRLAGTGDASFADLERQSVLDVGIKRFFESPVLGSGFADVELMHNVFVEIAVATGIIGLVGFLLVMWSFARPLIHGGELARLSYVALAFIGLGWTVPGLQDRTLWVPLVLSVLAAVELQDRLASRNEGEPLSDVAPMDSAPRRVPDREEAR